MLECVSGFSFLKWNHIPRGISESLAVGFGEQGFYCLSLVL